MPTERELRQAIRQGAREGKVACRFLLNLAARTKTSPRRIGQLCDKMHLRIRHCQLGCFD